MPIRLIHTIRRGNLRPCSLLSITVVDVQGRARLDRRLRRRRHRIAASFIHRPRRTFSINPTAPSTPTAPCSSRRTSTVDVTS